MKILCLLLLGFSNVIFAKDLTINELNDCKLKIVGKLYYSESAQAAVDNKAEKNLKSRLCEKSGRYL